MGPKSFFHHTLLLFIYNSIPPSYIFKISSPSSLPTQFTTPSLIQKNYGRVKSCCFCRSSDSSHFVSKIKETSHPQDLRKLRLRSVRVTSQTSSPSRAQQKNNRSSHGSEALGTYYPGVHCHGACGRAYHMGHAATHSVQV